MNAFVFSNAFFYCLYPFCSCCRVAAFKAQKMHNARFVFAKIVIFFLIKSIINMILPKEALNYAFLV